MTMKQEAKRAQAVKQQIREAMKKRRSTRRAEVKSVTRKAQLTKP